MGPELLESGVIGGSVGPELPDSGVDVGSASHSSSMVAAPEETDLKQYSFVSGAPILQYNYCDLNEDERDFLLFVNTAVKTIFIQSVSTTLPPGVDTIEVRGNIAYSSLPAAISWGCRLAQYRGD